VPGRGGMVRRDELTERARQTVRPLLPPDAASAAQAAAGRPPDRNGYLGAEVFRPASCRHGEYRSSTASTRSPTCMPGWRLRLAVAGIIGTLAQIPVTPGRKVRAELSMWTVVTRYAG